MSKPLVCTLSVTPDAAGAEIMVTLGRQQDGTFELLSQRRMPNFAAAVLAGTELAQRTLTVMRGEVIQRAEDNANDVVRIPLRGCSPTAAEEQAAAAALRLFMAEARISVTAHGGNATLAGLLSSFVNIALSAGANLEECAANLRAVADGLPDIQAKWALANVTPANAATPA